MPPDYYADVRRIRESSERLEISSRRLMWLTAVLAAETIVLVGLTFLPARPLFSPVVGPASMDLGVAIVGADTALYGFVIAYYAFSRSLHEQEKSRIFARLDATLKENRVEKPAADELWVGLLSRAAWVNLFLILCTGLAVPSAVSGFFFLGGFHLVFGGFDLFLGLETFFFGLFLLVLVGWMGAVGYLNFRYNVREFRSYPTTPKGLRAVLMRGLGKV
jgi:hypothetical protein